MQEMLLAAVFFMIAAIILVWRLYLYQKQARHMIKELSMLCEEDTNYQLTSCCHIGKTEEVIELFNRILQKERDEKARLKRENRTYRESITSISHDIRTPLTSAKGYLQMLSGGEVSEKKQHDYLLTISQRVDDVTGMLNQLFEYARLEAGEFEFSPERFLITNVFADTILMFYNDFLEKGCEPKLELMEAPCYLYADKHAVVRIMENLIKNALVHGTGDYRFSLENMDGRVVLTASNRTDSIEGKDIDRIFERFYTTDTSRTRKTTGLGLAIVKQFADQMGGSVHASLQEDIFTVKLELGSAV